MFSSSSLKIVLTNCSNSIVVILSADDIIFEFLSAIISFKVLSFIWLKSDLLNVRSNKLSLPKSGILPTKLTTISSGKSNLIANLFIFDNSTKSITDSSAISLDTTCNALFKSVNDQSDTLARRINLCNLSSWIIIPPDTFELFLPAVTIESKEIILLPFESSIIRQYFTELWSLSASFWFNVSLIYILFACSRYNSSFGISEVFKSLNNLVANKSSSSLCVNPVLFKNSSNLTKFSTESVSFRP